MNKNEIIKNFFEQRGHVGFYCENLITGERFGYHEDDQFSAGSQIKLPVLMCIAKWVSEGKADYKEKIKVKNEDKVRGSGALALFTDEITVDIRTLCYLMISVSDNTAMNVLVDRFGKTAFAEEFGKIGLQGTKLFNRIFRDVCQPENQIVLSEMGMLLRRIHERRFVDAQTSEDIEDILLHQHNNFKIPAYITDPAITIMHKTGEAFRRSLDAGIVYAKQPFVICFAGIDTDTAAFDDLIRKTTYEIFLDYQLPIPPVMLPGTEEREKACYHYLTEKMGLNPAAACGCLSNFYYESEYRSDTLQYESQTVLGFTEASYTDAVDNGSYKNFANDYGGYGLAQWTLPRRKAALLQYAKENGKSIGDPEMQMAFFAIEVQEYESVRKVIEACENNADGAYNAGYAICYFYEGPAAKEISSVVRGHYAKMLFEKYETCGRPFSKA